MLFKLDLEDQVVLSKRIAIMKLERNFTREDTMTLDAHSTIDFEDKVWKIWEWSNVINLIEDGRNVRRD